MLDTLIPAIRTMSSASDDASLSEILKSTSITANESADATAKLIAKRGRSSYLRERVLGHVDPGAKAVAVCFSALANAL
jgi:dihydroxyacetone kinase